MKKFLKDTRGVVMMEYIILGCFAVAVTVATVMALGNVYNNGLATMGWATLGCTQAAVDQQAVAEPALAENIGFAEQYASDLAQADIKQGKLSNFDVYIP